MPKSDYAQRYAQQELLHFPLSSNTEDELAEDDLLGNEELLNEARYESQWSDLAKQSAQPTEQPRSAKQADQNTQTTELLHSDRATLHLHDDREELLDASSLATILDMLAVITTIEELMLLESLTEIQKRQVWKATPEAVRHRLKQVREAHVTVSGSSSTWETLNSKSGGNQPMLRTGNQIVLVAHPKLTSAELVAIWNVVEVHEDYARIKSENLGFRNYPIKWMLLYA